MVTPSFGVGKVYYLVTFTGNNIEFYSTYSIFPARAGTASLPRRPRAKIYWFRDIPWFGLVRARTIFNDKGFRGSTGGSAMSEPPSPHPALHSALLYSYHITQEVCPIGDDLFSLLARFKYGRGVYTSDLRGGGYSLPANSHLTKIHSDWFHQLDQALNWLCCRSTPWAQNGCVMRCIAYLIET